MVFDINTTYFEERGGYEFAKEFYQEAYNLAVKDDRLSWYWHSKGVGGYGVFDYLTKIENMTFINALELLEGNTTTMQAAPRKQKAPVILKLPEKKNITVNLYKYLCVQRGIDSNIVSTLHDEGKVYENKDGNLVKRIDKTTYHVKAHFKKTGKENMSDKIKRMLHDEASRM